MSSPATAVRKRIRTRANLLLIGWVAAIVVSVIAALSWGVESISAQQALRLLISDSDISGADGALSAVVQQVRAPRVAIALIVGAVLGVAGAVSQGLFANPLAEPTIIGIASGAAVGLLLAVSVGWVAIASFGGVVAAVVGAAVTAVLISRWDRDGRDPLALLLAGIAVAALGNAVVGLITATSGRGDLRSISFWSLGSLSLATWQSVQAMVVPAALGVIGAIVLARRLDYLALGSTGARHLGVDVRTARALAFIVLALLIGSAVAIVGIIAFVGLVVPHVARLAVGPRHRHLLVHSALLGALLVLWADTTARTLLLPIEIPIGLITAVIGAPVLLVLLKWVRQP